MTFWYGVVRVVEFLIWQLGVPRVGDNSEQGGSCMAFMTASAFHSITSVVLSRGPLAHPDSRRGDTDSPSHAESRGEQAHRIF